MRVRGRRRCADCGETWSYYETGDVACPGCGSLRSVGTDDERRLHTDGDPDLDLSAVRAGVDDRPIRDVASDAADVARRYVVGRGFVRGGELLPLDDVVLAVAELRHAADRLRRSLSVSEVEERYFLSLLAGADEGARPDEPPPELRGARGLAAAEVVASYREDVSDWLSDHPAPAAAGVLESLRDHGRRIDALDGEVSPAEADRLVAAARDLGASLREGDAVALARARDRLERFG